MTDTRSPDAPPQGTGQQGSIQQGRGNFLAPVYLWVAGLKGWRALAFCAVLGTVANLAFPPFFFWPAMAFALSGLVWALDAARLAAKPLRSAFWRVFAFGFAYYLVGMHWIAFAFLVDANDYAIFIWMPLIALPGGLAAILAAFLTFASRWWCAGPARLVIFSVAFMLAEWFRSSLFGIGGLPWNLPGMIWSPGEAVSQSASIWGIYGLSMLTVIAMASPATLADARARGTTGSRAAPIIVAAIVFGAIWGFGARRLGEQPVTATTGQVVRLVEAGVPQNQKTRANFSKIFDRFKELTGPDVAGAPGIVIWPEGALPAWLDEIVDLVPPYLQRRLLVIGAARQGAGEDRKFYNSLAVLDSAQGARAQKYVYDKHMLVPFGEFTPFANILQSIGLKTLQDLAPGGFEAGPQPVSVKADGLPPFGPLICYEAIFPGLTSEGDDRPAWLVNVTNDAWFGAWFGPAQHAAQARYRAIEEGLPMARVAAGGFTGMIDGYGRWTTMGKPADPARFGADPAGWTSSVVDAAIPPALAATPYTVWRDGMFWIILLGLNLGLFVLPRR